MGSSIAQQVKQLLFALWVEWPLMGIMWALWPLLVVKKLLMHLMHCALAWAWAYVPDRVKANISLYPIIYIINHMFGGEYAIREESAQTCSNGEISTASQQQSAAAAADKKQSLQAAHNHNFINRVKKCYEDHRIITELTGGAIAAQAIPELDLSSANVSNMMRVSGNLSRPFIIRGLLKTHRCCQRWSLDFFESEYGDVIIPTFEDGDKLLDSSNLFHKRRSVLELSLAEHIAKIRSGSATYINNSSRLFTARPALLDDLEFSRIQQLFSPSVDLSAATSQLFFGGKNTGTAMHCAWNANAFFNIKGRKRWMLVDPVYSVYLKPVPSTNGLFAITPFDAFSSSEDNPITRLPRYDVVLEEGDFLFNPYWWWHAVRNESPYTIAVANRLLERGCLPFMTNIPLFSNNYLFSSVLLAHPMQLYETLIKPLYLRTSSPEVLDNYIVNNVAAQFQDND